MSVHHASNPYPTVTGFAACVGFPLEDWRVTSLKGSSSQWLAAFLVLATVSNFLTTSECAANTKSHKAEAPISIAARIIICIYRSNQKAHKQSRAPLVDAQRSVPAALIQSATPYTIVLLLLVTFVAGFNPEMFCIDALTPLIVRTRFHIYTMTDIQHYDASRACPLHS